MTTVMPGATPTTVELSRPNPLHTALHRRELPVTLTLIGLVVFTYWRNHLFLSNQGVKDLMLNATILMILACGQTLLIVTRNIDLSVGSILGLVAFACGALFADHPGIPIPLVFAICLAFGAALGAVNGLLVAVAKVPALVITLGTMYIFRGINNLRAGGTQYFAGDRPQAFGELAVNTVAGIPIITLLAIAVIAVVAVYLGGARRGRDLYAIGSEPQAAVLYGIPVTRRVFAAFVANGLLAGLAGVLYAARFNSVGATTGSGIELDVVAAAVVGGVAIFGGSGTVVGAAIGAVLLTTITSALTALRVDKFWQQAIVGALILSAILVERLASLRAARSLRTKQAADV